MNGFRFAETNPDPRPSEGKKYSFFSSFKKNLKTSMNDKNDVKTNFLTSNSTSSVNNLTMDQELKLKFYEKKFKEYDEKFEQHEKNFDFLMKEIKRLNEIIENKK